ncbi:MAG: FIST C-terminal domain-containing protein [Verrucomicrobiota bacterium]
MTTPPPQRRAASCVRLTKWDEDVVIAAARSLREQAGGASLALVFASPDWRPHLHDLVEIIQVEGHARRVVGCSADGMIGTDQEDEDVSGFSLMFLNLPGEDIGSWIIDENFQIPRDRPATGGWLILGNPLRLNAQALLEDMNRIYPGVPLYGGLATGGWDAETLFTLHHESEQLESAGIAIHLSQTMIHGIVSQGCQPIGEPYTITKVHDDVVLGVGGRRAYDVLVETFENLPEDDQKLAHGNIMAGLAASEYREEFQRGDFLVRNILGGDPKTGALKIGASPRVGQTLQFQLREKDAADEDLRVRSQALETREGAPLAMLCFSCGGRGQQLFGIPNHDAGILAETFGPIPVAGFFCNGEFGPVAGVNFLHGYTAAVAALY